VIRNGENGFVHTDVDALVDAMSVLLRDPAEARRLGAGARCTALKRFNIDRFTRDWHETLLHVTA
jgi:glycosyltransferase involved in cell wall biosynthesis